MKFDTPRKHITSDWWSTYVDHQDNARQKINVQTLAKTPVLLDCLRAPDGFKFVSMDFESLEAMVLAYLSKDPCYYDIYASGKPHDAYLYVACKLLDDDGSLSKVYQIDNPTKETVKAAKKKFKSLRTVAKVFTLMSTYKASPGAIQRKLSLFGMDYSAEQVKDIHAEYWGPKLFQAVLEYESDLLAQVRQNNGFFYNWFGRPLVVSERKEKDVINISCQSVGHDILDNLLFHIDTLVKGDKYRHLFQPVLPDYHDETIWMAPTELAPRLAQIFSQALEMLNKQLGWNIPMRGDPEITDNFTQFKNPDPDDQYETWLIENGDKNAE